MESKLAKEICPTKTQIRINEGALLVDVREQDEVNQLAFDVPDIVNIPLSEFEQRYHELPRNRELVMVCRGGGRSLKATYYLMNRGYENVINMQYGITRWVKRGFPVKGDINTVLEESDNTGCCDTTSLKKKESPCCDSL